jgi:DNA-binding transcriptional MerR regulator/effector-binding domain-containing protein
MGRERFISAWRLCLKRTLVYTIGEFSRITGLSVKTLRFYHEQGLLEPSSVDEQSGYRYYAPAKIEIARIITGLRALDLPLAEIAGLLRLDDGDVLAVLQRQRTVIEEKLRKYRGIARSLDQLIATQKEERMFARSASYTIEEKPLAPMLIAAIRVRGHYDECGKAFGRIGRNFGRYLNGPPLILHYDAEYRENDADFEACFPIRQRKDVEGIEVRELPGGMCVSLIHKGPYDELGRSYAKVFDYLDQKNYHVEMPTREIYLKCPGMIFKGNPKKYLTEIQIPVKAK